MASGVDVLRRVQRTAAYAVVRDATGAHLLVRASRRSDFAGRWGLPGGGVGHGEHPQAALLREVAEETGLAIAVTGVRDAVADVYDLPHRGVSVHTIRLLFDAELSDPDAVPRPEVDGTSDRAQFVSREDAAGLTLLPYVADLMGLPVERPVPTVPMRPEPLGGTADVHLDGAPEGGRPVPMQRAAAYAVLRDGDRVLLTHLTGSGGLWTLPGGGIDHGEDPAVALRREVHEETGLPFTPGRLRHVSSRRFTGRAPSGRLEDFHGIRLIYDGAVPTDVPPTVIEVDGTTDVAAWVRLGDLSGMRLSGVVRIGLDSVGPH